MVSAAAVRKTVSVVFCDLAGSTAVGEQLDPEALRVLLSGWYEAMRGPVERHGGTVEKFIGDAVMAVFGVPHVHEDDALRAVRAAVEMRDAAAALGEGLTVRIGVNTGEVVTGDAATTLVTGDAVNTAKRLEQAAPDGEILIGEGTRRLVENAVELEPVAPVQARGKRQPVPAFRVVATIPGAPAFARRLDARLVGRRVELALLRGELERARHERSLRLVTVLGAAGIGKSRLASELLAEASGQATILTGRCPPYGEGITFLPLHDLVRAAGGEASLRAALAEEPDAAMIVERLSDERLRFLSGTEPLSSEEAFWAVRRVFQALARERPLVVCLEDVHWAAPTFLDLLEYLAGWSRDAPILLLCLARPELLDVRPRWAGRLIDLEALDDTEAAALLDELTAEWPLPGRARLQAVEAAEGNPLFLEQLVAMLSDDEETTTLPPTIHALLAARLDRLPPDDRGVLGRAAVAGREFRRDAVVELSPDAERPHVGSVLLRLVREQLVAPQPSELAGDDEFRFRHALIRDAAYAELPKASRAGLHERFAAWLEGTDAESELVAYHLERAWLCRRELGVTGPETAALAERAGALLAACGDHAFARGDMPAARSLLTRAAALTDGLSPDIRRRLSLALWSTGETEEAVRVLDEVVRDAERIGDARTLWLARIEAVVRQSVSDPGFRVDEIVTTCERAIAVFAELGDEAALARAWLWTAYAHRIVGRLAAGSRAAEIGVRHAAAGAAPEERARLEDELCTALLDGPADVEQGLERCEELLAGNRDSALEEANVLSAVAGLRALKGDFDGARDALDRAAELFGELGLQFALAGLRKISGDVEVLAGDLDAAEEELRAGLELISAIGTRAIFAASLAHVLLSQGREDEARGLVGDAEEVAGPYYAAQVLWRSAKARLLSADGSDAEATALAREAVGLAGETDALVLRGQALIALSQVAASAGDHEASAAAAAEALELYRRKGGAAAERWAALQAPRLRQRL